MCMCCEIPIYVNKFMGSINIYDALKYIYMSLVLMTLLEVILTITAICGDYTEDILTEILYYSAIAACVYATLWAFIAYKKTTAGILLVTEYATLMVPLPCLSLFGYTLLTQEVFFYVDHVFQVSFAALNMYYAVCIHTIYIEQLQKEEAEETAKK